MADKNPKVEEHEESSSDDEMPGLEEGAPEAGAEGEDGSKQSRGEKKARKALLKLGMKSYPGVLRVSIKKGRGLLFNIENPEVYKSPASDTYVIFGEAKIEDMNQRAAQEAASKLAAAAGDEAPKAAADGAKAKADEGDDGEVDETGVEAKDIELVMSQSGVTRAKAVKAIKANNGDIVNAIMELTM